MTKKQQKGTCSPLNLKTFRIVPNGLIEDILNFLLFSGASDSGRTKNPNKKFRPVRNAERKNGAREFISPKTPPSAGPSIKPTPKAAPIMPKFFAFSSG